MTILKLHLEGKFYVESDSRQYILKQYTGKFDDDGKELYKVHGYYQTLESSLRKFIRMEINKSTAETVDGLIQYLDYIDQKVDYFLEDINKIII